MRPRHRIRKTIKWAGATTLCLLVAMWFLSGWYEFGVQSFSGQCTIDQGSLFVIDPIGGLPSGNHYWLRLHRSASDLRAGIWNFRWAQADGGYFVMHVLPLWIPFTLILIPTACAWRLDTLARRRATSGHCPKCHYNRAGLPAHAPCPECGKPIATAK